MQWRKSWMGWVMLVGVGISHAADGGVKAEWPAVAARYSSQQCALPCKSVTPNVWFFWRKGQQVEMRSADGETGERWIHNASQNSMEYVYLMPNDKKSIEYTAVDLKLIEKEVSWEKVAGMITTAELKAMTLKEETRWLGYRALRYVGNDKQTEKEVVWIPELKLAAKILQRNAGQESLVKLDAFDDGHWQAKPLTDAQLQDFLRVEYTDIGDMEHSPAYGWLRKAVNAPRLGAHDHNVRAEGELHRH